MSNLQAALGVAQLERLDGFVERKHLLGKRYHELLDGISGLQLPLPSTSFAENIYWVFGVVLHEDIPFDAEEAMRRLAGLGVGTRPFFWPMHEQPVFKNLGLFDGEKCPNAELIARRGFYLPSGLGLTNVQIERVAESVQIIMRG